MKTKFIYYIILFLIFLINSQIKADTILFDSKNLEIKNDGNLIYSGKGNAKIPSQKIIIKG